MYLDTVKSDDVSR